MSVDVKAPSLGESVSEIYIGTWHKAEGDRVEQDEPLVELESDKATLDLNAPSAGVLTKILKQQGEVAEAGDVIAVLEDESPAKSRSEEAPAKTEAQEKPAQASSVDAEPAPAPKKRRQPPAEAESALPGSDVKSDPAPERHEGPAPEREATKAERHDGSDGTSVERIDRQEDRVPMTPLRRRIADRLVEAQRRAALLTTFNEIDMSAVKHLRTEFGDSFERKHGVRLGFMSFFVRATVHALEHCPELNAIIDGDDIVYRRYYDVGVAVSTPRGLVVPILRDAQRMSFAKIERTIEDMAKRARDGALRVDELQGGTFTVTNGGVFGSLMSTPLVNPPQSGVLGMHAIQDRPVAVDQQVVIKPMMYVALTYDHRIVDGREAVTFLRRIKEAVESPSRLLLEV